MLRRPNAEMTAIMNTTRIGGKISNKEVDGGVKKMLIIFEGLILSFWGLEEY